MDFIARIKVFLATAYVGKGQHAPKRKQRREGAALVQALGFTG
ncbi:hypothetical protein AB2B41_06715 [Marimonas sp. MJW-29]|uniref:Uncharacterized protein n=1 Tax=Sulfitobacter sediminis TaxID=3234186 RepID=A0ABV3RMI5_9RHOB